MRRSSHFGKKDKMIIEDWPLPLYHFISVTFECLIVL